MAGKFNLLITNVMIDLETLGTQFNAGILSIGAVKFNFEGIKSKFYQNISIRNNVEVGRTIDKDTLRWWKDQRPEAIEALAGNTVSLEEGLIRFNTWYGDKSHPTWSNGADFDQVIMRSAEKDVGLKEPWEYKDGMCYRTLKGLIDIKELFPPTNEDSHNALSDAIWQAEHVRNMWNVFAD